MYMPVPLITASEQPRVEVAAGLLDRLIPDEQHVLLVFGRQRAADDPPELRPLGHDVEREQRDRRPAEDPAEDRRGDAEDVARQARGGTHQVLRVLLDLVGQVLGGDVPAELVRPSHERVDELRRRLDQLLRAGDDRGDHQRDQEIDRQEHAQEDQSGRRAAAPATRGEPVDGRLDREREEERREQDADDAGELAT